MSNSRNCLNGMFSVVNQMFINGRVKSKGENKRQWPGRGSSTQPNQTISVLSAVWLDKVEMKNAHRATE